MNERLLQELLVEPNLVTFKTRQEKKMTMFMFFNLNVNVIDRRNNKKTRDNLEVKFRCIRFGSERQKVVGI